MLLILHQRSVGRHNNASKRIALLGSSAYLLTGWPTGAAQLRNDFKNFAANLFFDGLQDFHKTNKFHLN